MKINYCAVILNRNLGSICDSLRDKLINSGIENIVVVDSSTDKKLKSKFSSVEAQDVETIKNGYRINRGFNAGIEYALKNFEFDWIICLPVDTEIIKINLSNFEKTTAEFTKISAYVPLREKDPYLDSISGEIGLAWNVSEGPIILKRDLLERFARYQPFQLFDNSNFRGYLSFKDLAIKLYGSDLGIGITKCFVVNEKEDLLLNFSELMKTEELELSKKLMLEEGQFWLFQKYGFENRWELENILRLCYLEFLNVNPRYKEIEM
jgi:hypothetical protein